MSPIQCSPPWSSADGRDGRLPRLWLASDPISSWTLLPHWECDWVRKGAPEGLLKFAKHDGVLGLAAMGAATLAADRRARVATDGSVAGAVHPDFDKPVKHFFGFDPFPRSIQRIHSLAQNESPEAMPKVIARTPLLAVTDAIIVAESRASWRPSVNFGYPRLRRW